MYQKQESPIMDTPPDGFSLGRLAILKSVRRTYPETPNVFGMGAGAHDGKRVWYRDKQGALEIIPISSKGDWSGLTYTVAAHCVEPIEATPSGEKAP